MAKKDPEPQAQRARLKLLGRPEIEIRLKGDEYTREQQYARLHAFYQPILESLTLEPISSKEGTDRAETPE